MSKSSELDQTVKRYLIDCIDATGHDQQPETTKEKISFLHKCFQNEAGYNITRIGYQKAVAEWLSGLPSSCTIAFYNSDILNLAVKWGSIPKNATEKQQDKILENYWNFMAAKLCQLFSGYRIPKDEELGQ